MNLNSIQDSIEEPMTLAAADTTRASSLAEVQAQPQASAAVAVEMPAAAVAVVAAPAVGLAPLPVLTASSVLPPANPLGTLSSSAHNSLPMIGALLLVVALILGLGKLVKRVQNTRIGQGPTLNIKGGIQVGGKERVVWIQAGDTHLLLGVSPGRVQTLHVFDVAPDFQMSAANEPIEEPAADTPATRDFSDRLKTLMAHARAKGLDVDAASAPVPAAPAVAAAPRAATTPALFSFRV